MKRENRKLHRYQTKMPEGKERPVVVPRNILLPAMIIAVVIKLYDTPHPTLMRVLYLLSIAFVLGEVYMSYMKHKLKITVHPVAIEIYKTREVDLKITVKNTSFLPLPYTYLILKDSWQLIPEETKCICLTLPGKTEHTYKIRYKAQYSGVTLIGVERVILLDYFECIKRRVNKSAFQEVMILPQFTPIEALDINHDLEADKSQKLEDVAIKAHSQGEMSYELSPYKEGESERLVHWKLVAQREIYMVRERENLTTKRPYMLIIVDPIFPMQVKPVPLWRKIFPRLKIRWVRQMDFQKAEQMDQMITTCISYLHNLLMQEEVIKLVCYQSKQWHEIEVKQIHDLEVVSKALCKDSFITTGEIERKWPQIDGSTYTERLLLTACADEEVERLKGEGMQVIAIKIHGDEKSKEGMKPLNKERRSYVASD